MHLLARMARGVALLALAGMVGCSALLGLEDPKDRTTSAGGSEIIAMSNRPIGRSNKIDLLFVIDNSPSMGDKQALLSQAVPDLINRFAAPNCVDEAGKPNGVRADPTAAAGKECSQGRAEFAPIVDIHVGILSSSMGGFGSTSCDGKARNPIDPLLDAHENDKGHLLNRSGPGEVPVANASPSNFLAWYPDVPGNAGKPSGTTPYTGLAAFQDAVSGLVVGVNQYGCGFEAPLESFYHFLIQPDPYEAVVRQDNKAAYSGLDSTILQQRADFLRPDSLVAIVLLSDEDDSSVDPLSFAGQGWAFMEREFPSSRTFRDPKRGGTTAPKSTSACDTDPGSSTCTSCLFKTNPTVQNDPKCMEDGGFYRKDDDDMNVRFHKMKQRYGVDPQYPIRRYVDGLTKAKVPDRFAEHDETGTYVDKANCTNPLFAKDLPRRATSETDPALCNLARGPRSSDLVYFAVLGGIPQDLLHFDPASPEKSALTEYDWVKLSGKNPDAYDLSGIDPRMDQSVKPRAGRPPPSTVSGDNEEGGQLRDWNTFGQDLQYACTFPLNVPVDCTTAKGETCDCQVGKYPPLCASPTVQSRGKAYPTTRELRVARGLKKQAVVSSLCPITYAPQGKDVGGAPNPLYGYRPVTQAIMNRLVTPSYACLPREPERDEFGRLACSMFVTLPEGSTCPTGYSRPEASSLRLYREEQKKLGLDSSLTVCFANQIETASGQSCATDRTVGWCYVSEPGCALGRAVVLSSGFVPPLGATLSLLCAR